MATSKINTRCQVFAICEDKPFPTVRKIWLILTKTVIMRNYTPSYLLVPSPLFVGDQVMSKSGNNEVLFTATPSHRMSCILIFPLEHTHCYTLAFLFMRKEKEQNIKGTEAETDWNTSRVVKQVREVS